MKKLFSVLFITLLFSGSQFFLKAQNPTPNPKNIELAQRFTYFLDNGFEKIDLMKVPDIDKSFFNLGNAQLIICDKNDTHKKNLINSFTIIAESADQSIPGKIFQMPSSTFTSNCKQYITGLKSQSKITFSEVKLNTTLPITNAQAPGSKYVIAPGVMPIAFYLYIK